MKFVDEYRDRDAAQGYFEQIGKTVTRDWNIMEVCGGQTHTIVKYGIDQLLPESLSLIHGPGCPVCVTPASMVDRAIALALMPEVTLCSFGDMMRVPGSEGDLLSARAAGGDVRMVYSPLDALELAIREPDRQVVFFAVGFETTVPVTAAAVLRAGARSIGNFFMLVSHVLVPPAMKLVLSGDDCRVNGFLAAGHVCSVMGYEEYIPIAEEFKVPIVVTGFEPLDILEGIHMCADQLERGEHRVENQYARAVQREGNSAAMVMMNRVFKKRDMKWRGLGEIPGSGLALREEFSGYDAAIRFEIDDIHADESGECISGEIMMGLSKPAQCPAFGRACTPQHPLGAPMVSSEGACAAYYRYRRESNG